MKELFVCRKNEEIVKENLQFLQGSRGKNSLTGLGFHDNDLYPTEYFDEKIILDAKSLTIKNILNTINIIKQKKFDCAYIPCSNNEISKKNQNITIEQNNLILIGLFFLVCGITNIRYIIDQNIVPFGRVNLILNFFKIVIKSLFTPFIIVLSTPVFFVKEILPNFILQKEDKNDPNIGWGLFKKMSSSMAFWGRAKMAEKYGVFGINYKDYMGIPISLHRSPLDIFFLIKLGFKRYVYLSIVLITISCFQISLYTGNYFVLLVLPFIFCSTYFIKSIVVSHLEFLAWGFFSLAIAFYISNQIILSGVFLALCILTHISIGILGSFCIFTFSLFEMVFTQSIIPTLWNFLVCSLITGLLSIIFLGPFLMNRHKLSRTELLNTMYGWKPIFIMKYIYQGIIYGLFVVSLFLCLPVSPFHFVTIIPLLMLYYNSKIQWIFSEYTIELAMLFIGLLIILMYPHPLTIVVYLFLIYTSPKFLVGPYYRVTEFKIPITPITLGHTREKIINLFKALPVDSRVALESGNRIKNAYAFEYNCLLSYVLVNESIELVNGYGPEMVESSIYFNIDQYLHENATQEQVRSALVNSGAHYIAVYSENFKNLLESWGYNLINIVDCRELELNDLINGPSIYLLNAPYTADIIAPHANLIFSPNQIQFYANAAKTRYFIKYNYYSGWRAYQNGKQIMIEDAKPGMFIQSDDASWIELRYRYINYWLNFFDNLNPLRTRYQRLK